jgi:tetratricopeptide (TPR) repeat protein
MYGVGSDRKLQESRRLLHESAYREAENLLLERIEEIELQMGQDVPQLIEPLYLYAQSVSKQHPWSTLLFKEEMALERGLGLAVRYCGENSRRTMRIRETLAVRLRSTGRIAVAAEHMAIVVCEAERIHGEGVLLAHAINGLADMFIDLRRFEEAVVAYERSFEMTRGCGDELMDFAILFGQGRCLVELGRYGEAVLSLERACEWFARRFGESNPRTSELRNWLERARQGQGGGGSMM